MLSIISTHFALHIAVNETIKPLKLISGLNYNDNVITVFSIITCFKLSLIDLTYQDPPDLN